MQNKIPINSIKIETRIRKELGDISGLAASIKQYGLLSPIVINKNNVLLAGERRFKACEGLGWTEIDAIIKETTDEEQERLIEIVENKDRKSFTREEIIDAGMELERIEKVKAEERMNNSVNQYTQKRGVQNFAQGKTRDIVATYIGMSHTQYEREKYIVEHKDILSPEEYQSWNNREFSTNKAYTIIKTTLGDRLPQKQSKPTEIIKEVIPADYEDLKKRLAAKEKEAENLANQRDQIAERNRATLEEVRRLKKHETPNPGMDFKQKMACLEDDLEEANTRIAELEKENAQYKEDTNRLLDRVTELEKTDLDKDCDVAYSLWKAASEFVKNVLSQFRYDEIVIRNENNLYGEYIMKSCHLLIDEANNILQRYSTIDVIDAEIIN